MVIGVQAITAEQTKKAWGTQLAKARRDIDRSQADIAAATRLDQKTISNAERGIGSFETFVAIANELHVNILGGDL